MSDTVAVLGLLTVMTAVAVAALALYVRTLAERVTHLTRIVLTLTREREAETGTRIAVDHSLLLGEPEDIIAAEGSDIWSRVPDKRPWGVREDEAGER